MRFDNVRTLEIPQGATELTTSQLEQISGGHQSQAKNSKYPAKFKKFKKSGHDKK
jgi:bacteriocin-like protein